MDLIESKSIFSPPGEKERLRTLKEAEGAAGVKEGS